MVVMNVKKVRKGKRPCWSLQTSSIIKELGQGFYSKVYLAQDQKKSFVAIKTVQANRDNQSIECILNKDEVLKRMKTHQNV